MGQDGWSDPRTILRLYRRNLRERHVREFEAEMGLARPASDVDEPPRVRVIHVRPSLRRVMEKMLDGPAEGDPMRCT